MYLLFFIRRISNSRSESRPGQRSTRRVAPYPDSLSSLAAQALSFRMAGPLTPQWVTSRGPRCSNFPRAVRSAHTVSCTLTPARSLRPLSGTLKVKREGIGRTMVWPRSFAKPQPALDDPVARSRLEDWMSPSLAVVTWNPPPRPSATDVTLHPLRTSTPTLSASETRQLMMVSEELLFGKTRPSGSTLSSTPRSSSQSLMSIELNRWKGPLSSL